ncbi:hypothetical protein GCM10010911_19650 [Paenibacillus nasutitermitis]|uniref:Uncharacterized protein n=1 Tax=Paenibacillus nasutitermitis TaxID=1652958 RepID=A0A916YV71_9BACL|nr:hypothetical protein GCM10010911_19650 [Paenibacillus nasutitermitis]
MTRISIQRKSHTLRLFYFMYRSSCRLLKTRTSIQSREPKSTRVIKLTIENFDNILLYNISKNCI